MGKDETLIHECNMDNIQTPRIIINFKVFVLTNPTEIKVVN